MKVFIVYCHPSEDSFTRSILDSFVKGVEDAGNECIISDLYQMDFKADMSEEEYLRDSYYRTEPDVSSDVSIEQEKINSADAIVFIYPVFWTEAPAKLVGWFDRVWSYGFAYGDREMKTLEKGLVLCSAGNPIERLEQFGYLESMKKVMLNDRLADRVKKSEFVVFPSTSREKALRKTNWDKNLELAYTKGKSLFDEEKFSMDNRFFTAIENSESGEVSASTVFNYHQKDNVIWAEYSGGSVVKGILLGTIDADNNMHFKYQHINVEGELKEGSCDSKPQVVNGKLRFYEKWKWTMGESGESIIEEL